MNISPHTFELSLDLLQPRYKELKNKAYDRATGSHQMSESKIKSGEYCTVHSDKALASSGVTVEYHESFMQHSIKLIVNPSKVLGGDDIPKLWKPTDRNIKALLRELKAHIKDYFDSEYKLKDFMLTRIDLTANIDVGNRENVSRYIRSLYSMGKVKGFTPKYKKSNKGIDKTLSFDLVKKLPYIEFSAYDKEAQSKNKAAKGILRVEIRLMKIKEKGNVSDHIKSFSKSSKDTFMNIFQKIVPRGNYYTKKQALVLIEDKIAAFVPNKRERENTLERMKKLIDLVPKKKSLRLAQEALRYRDIDRIMTAFAECNIRLCNTLTLAGVTRKLLSKSLLHGDDYMDKFKVGSKVEAIKGSQMGNIGIVEKVIAVPWAETEYQVGFSEKPYGMTLLESSLREVLEGDINEQ